MRRDVTTYPIDPDTIKRADILLVHTRRSPFACLVRLLTKSYWNHAALFISKDNQWPKWVIEALYCGVVASCFEVKYLKVTRNDSGKILSIKPSSRYDIAIVRCKDLTSKHARAIASQAYQWALYEQKYDFLLFFIGMLLHLLTFRKWHHRWLQRRKALMCSELIATAFHDATGIKFLSQAPIHFTAPADIARCAKVDARFEFVAQSLNEKVYK